MNGDIVRAHAAINGWQTVWLVLVLFATAGLAGYVLLGMDGLVISLAAIALTVLIEPLVARPITLALYRARPIDRNEAPRLWAVLETLSRRAGLPTRPTLHLVSSPVANAFAVGHAGNSAIAVSTGLLQIMSLRETAGILAHEIGHIANGDLRVMGLADHTTRLTTIFAVIGLVLFAAMIPAWLIEGEPLPWLGLLILAVAPYLTQFAQAGLSRVREFDADLTAAQLTGNPESLAAALAKVEGGVRTRRGWLLPDWRGQNPSWLRTHPPTAERIRRLMSLSRTPVVDAWEHNGW